MAKLWRQLFGKSNEIQRYSLDEYYQKLTNFGVMPRTSYRSSGYDKKEVIENDFASFSDFVFKQSPVVFGAMEVRGSNFSQIRFQWQDVSFGKTRGKVFGNSELSVLEYPWPNASTAELLRRMEQDVSLAGNAYVVREENQLRRLQPDWVAPVLSRPHYEAVQSDILGYVYCPGGLNSGNEETYYTVDEVAHWAPTPNPTYQYIGMSWIQAILREVQADKAASEHKLNFFRNGATLQTVISPKADITIEQFQQFMDVTNGTHVGVENAYKPLYLGFGADVQVVGTDIQQLDFQTSQGRDETRIAMAARVPAVILGISEGLQGSSLNAGNFSAARRNFVDGFLWSHWTSACNALQSILDVPAQSRLWFETKDVPLLREDQHDAAEIQQIKAITIRQLTDAGFVPETVVASVEADDRSLLQHSNLFSVQLQPPGTTAPEKPEEPTKSAPAEPVATTEEVEV